MHRTVALGILALLLFYAGLAVIRQNRLPAASANLSIAYLERAVHDTGGTLDSAVLTLNEPVNDAAQWARIAARVWPEEAQTEEDRREIALVEEGGGPVVKLTWRLAGEAAAGWAGRHAALSRAMVDEGLWVPIYVELSGRLAEGADPLRLAHVALDGVEARQREPWSDGRSASVAGWSGLLPPGPYEVNVQAAARRTAHGVRFWIGWPAVRTDY